MKLGDKIEVPELDELRAARLERAIVAEVAALENTRARPRRLWAGAAATVAVAGVLLAIALNLRAAQVPLLGAPPALSEQPTEVVTGPNQSTRLMLGDAEVQVGEQTRLRVQRYSDGRIVLHLEAGFVDCEVEPRPNRPSFEVLSGDVAVKVIGTKFQVERGNVVDVRVQRGIVGITTSYQSVKLRAGEDWQGSPYADRTLALLLQEEAARLAEREAQAISDAEYNANQKPRRGKAHRAKHHEGGDAGPRAANEKPRAPEEPLLLSEILKGAKPLPPIFKKSHAPELAELQQISARNPQRAVVALEALAATSTGSEASFALYSRAYLLFFRLQRNEAVVTAAQQYSRRFPKGAEAEDMLWLRVRASCEANNYPSCRAAAHTYLRRYPQGIFQGLAARIIRIKSDSSD